MKEFIENQTVIKIGENATENWELLNTNPNFIWLHLDSFPSCHTIIESENPSKDIILAAAILCKSHTKYKNIKNIKVCITARSNLKKGKNIGSVIFKSKKKVSYLKL
jgi:predicted ribosome quality control (RQC) complex YloA/Tae2 family protein